MADRVRLAALTLLAAGLLLPGLLVGPSLDAAVFVQVATQVREGDVLYVDAWDHKPPGGTLILVALQSLLPFIDSWLVAWLIGLAATVATAMLVAGILESMGTRPLAASLAGGAVVVVMAQYLMALGGGLTEPLGTAFLAVALALAVRAAGIVWMAVVGALLAASVLTSIPLAAGAGIVAAVAAARAGRKLSAVALLAAGALLPVVAVAGWLVAIGAAGPAIDAVIGYAGAYRLSNQETGSALSAPVVSWTLLALLFVIVPALIGAVPAIRAAQPRRWLIAACVAWIALSIGLFVVQGRFFAHYAIPLAIPLGILAGLGLERLMGRRVPDGRPVARLVQYLPLAFGVLVSAIALPVAGWMELSPVARQAERVDRVATAIESATPPGASIWVWGTAPQLYRAADRAVSTPFAYLYPLVTPGYASDDLIAATVRDLTDDPPALIVDAGSPAPGAPGFQPLLITRPVASDGRDLDILDPLREFVRARYVELEVVDGWVLYRLGEESD